MYIIEWDLPSSIIGDVVKRFESKKTEVFSTIEFISEWKDMDLNSQEEFEKLRGRNWRALIGKALKKYSNETSKFRQITPPHVSPARWRFV